MAARQTTTRNPPRISTATRPVMPPLQPHPTPPIPRRKNTTRSLRIRNQSHTRPTTHHPRLANQTRPRRQRRKSIPPTGRQNAPPRRRPHTPPHPSAHTRRQNQRHHHQRTNRRATEPTPNRRKQKLLAKPPQTTRTLAHRKKASPKTRLTCHLRRDSSHGGGWGIRTPEGLHPTRFPSVRHRPLGESS